MGFAKYFIVGLLAIGLFVGGAFFVRLVEQKDSFLGNKEKSHFSQTLTSQKQLPIELYVGAFGFKAQKNELSTQEKQLIKSTLSSVIERVRKEQNCNGGEFDLQNDNQGNADKEPDLRGVIECKFDKEEFKNYQAMIKDIDYLALKSGVVSLANYGIEPIITSEQLSISSKEAYTNLSQEIKKQKSAIEGGFGVKCSVERVEFFDDSYRQNLQGHHSAVLSDMGANTINGANAGGKRESSLDDFTLPLQSSKNVEFKSFISFQCK